MTGTLQWHMVGALTPQESLDAGDEVYYASLCRRLRVDTKTRIARLREVDARKKAVLREDGDRVDQQYDDVEQVSEEEHVGQIGSVLSGDRRSRATVLYVSISAHSSAGRRKFATGTMLRDETSKGKRETNRCWSDCSSRVSTSGFVLSFERVASRHLVVRRRAGTQKVVAAVKMCSMA
jgi:hypothetical protein